jgi:TonB family protein
MFKAKHGRLSRLACLVLFSTICLITASVAQDQTPARASSLPSDGELDALVEARDWGGLSTALSQATDGEPFRRKLQWLRSRIPAGGPSLLGFTAVRDTWKVGIQAKEPEPENDFRITAGLLTLYTYELILIDGAKCEDQSAPAHRVEELLQSGGPALAFLRSQSNEFVAHVIDNAIAMEAKTAPLRKEDDLLCRDGMEQMKAGMERGTQHEIATAPGHTGKTTAVEAPADWAPTFLPPEKYKPAQDKARADMKANLLLLVDSAPQRVQVDQGVAQGLLLSSVPPNYPPLARQARIQGTVVLRAIIGKDGAIANLTLVSGHPMLAPAAIAAVKQWKYKPYLLNGETVEVETEVKVNFTLSGG